MAEASATAEGEIARTPFAHLLIYALDRRLSGVMFLVRPDGVEHVIRFTRGVPVKIRPSDRYALLGEMLIEAGAIDAETLEAALATKGLLGDMLLVAGRVDRDALERIAEQQFVRRMVRCFELPPGTSFRYFDGHAELLDYGGDPACVDPLALLWAGLAANARRSTMMESTLALLGDKPMRLHPSATVSRFGLDAGCQRLLDRLNTAPPPTLADLDALEAVSEETVRCFAYALMITRQLDTGANTTPLCGEPESSRAPGGVPSGAEPTPRAIQLPMGGAAGPPQTPLITTAVGRMQLKSTMHRVGAAAPDLPGDGERGATAGAAVRSSRKARAQGESIPSDPPSSHERLSSAHDEVGARSVAEQAPGEQAAAPRPSGDYAPQTARSSTLPEPLSSSEVKAKAPALEPDRDSGVIPVPPATRAVRHDLGGTTLRSQPAPALTPADAAPADPLAGKSGAELLAIARDRQVERDLRGALAAADAARRVAPEDPDVIAVGTWVRFQLGRADVKALAVELDELLAVHSDHVDARFYRAMLRKRLSDEAGCASDLRRLLETAPDHAEARRELAAIEARPANKDRPSLFGRLFKR